MLPVVCVSLPICLPPVPAGSETFSIQWHLHPNCLHSLGSTALKLPWSCSEGPAETAVNCSETALELLRAELDRQFQRDGINSEER